MPVATPNAVPDAIANAVPDDIANDARDAIPNAGSIADPLTVPLAGPRHSGAGGPGAGDSGAGDSGPGDSGAGANAGASGEPPSRPDAPDDQSPAEWDAPATPFAPKHPIVLGLLGGVAAGKSAVARAFAAHGLVRIDADREARAVTEREDVRLQLRQAFGDDVLDDTGALRRDRLAALVFADPAARARLEAITHPPVRAAILEQIEAARRAGRSVVLDVPLLLEGGLIERCDVCVFVEAAPEVRRTRAAARGWPPGELERREAAQAPLWLKKARSTYIIRNDASVNDMRRQVAEVLERIARARP